jgi:predicted small integral membrane protein
MSQPAGGLASLAALRLAKAGLVAGVALYFTLIALNNILDYGVNLALVEHVLRMDTTLPASRLTWRAVRSPLVHHAAYAGIIAWEAMAAALLWTGAVGLSRAAWGATPYARSRSRRASRCGSSPSSRSEANGS